MFEKLKALEDKFNEIKKELENNSIKLNIEKELLVEL